MDTPQASTILIWTSYWSQSPQPFYGVTVTNTVGPRCKRFSKCSCRCAPNVLSCAPTAQFAKSCWMYLAFGSCGYIAQKTLYLTAPACPLSTQPVGLGMLGPEVMCGVYSGRCGPRSPSCVIMPGLCLPTAQHAGLILNVISVLSMACFLSTEWFRTVQLCQIRPKAHLTPASCLWERQVEVSSGDWLISSQKYFHILHQFMLQQLSQMW